MINQNGFNDVMSKIMNNFYVLINIVNKPT